MKMVFNGDLNPSYKCEACQLTICPNLTFNCKRPACPYVNAARESLSIRSRFLARMTPELASRYEHDRVLRAAVDDFIEDLEMREAKIMEHLTAIINTYPEVPK